MNILDTAIAYAIDHDNARVAGSVVDALRPGHWTHAQIFARVQAVRPEASAAQWDRLLCESEGLEQ